MKTRSKTLILMIIVIGLVIIATPTLGDSGLAGLAIGVREPDSIGGVHVLPSTAGGPSVPGGQYWNQDQPDVDGVAAGGDKFGDAVVWGDFDGNGFPDLAIGTPKDSNGSVNHGSVNVLYGTDEGLSATGSQYLDQAVLGVGALEMDDLFGHALAVGDFDNDGFDDLVISAPGEALGEVNNAGVLDVVYGSAGGLTQVGILVISQDTSGVFGDVEEADLFGFSLAVGNFNGDAYDDLAVGVPYEDLNDDEDWDAGQINLLYGSATGLIGTDEYHHQDTFCDDCAAEQGDRFGFALAAGDFNNDNFDDLAIGVPYEYLGDTPNVGLVNILYGSLSGLEDKEGFGFWSMFNQDALDIPNCESENMDLFGYSLAAGDLNGDGFSDLVIGSPGESHPFVNTHPLYSSGGLNVMYGTLIGLGAFRAQWFDQDTAGVGDVKEAGDRFGHSLAVGNLNGDNYDDLVVGVPFEDIDSMRDAGIVILLYGTENGPVGNEQWIGQQATGLGETEAYDLFGISLAIWPYDFPYASWFADDLPKGMK